MEWGAQFVSKGGQKTALDRVGGADLGGARRYPGLQVGVEGANFFLQRNYSGTPRPEISLRLLEARLRR